MMTDGIRYGGYIVFFPKSNGRITIPYSIGIEGVHTCSHHFDRCLFLQIEHPRGTAPDIRSFLVFREALGDLITGFTETVLESLKGRFAGAAPPFLLGKALNQSMDW